jgi:Flp pilus assembly protein TadG
MFTTMMKRLAQRARSARLRSLIVQFRSNKRGNVAVITALCCLPLIAAVGCVIDYTTASLVKTKLQAAADAAALATVSVNSSVITTANGNVSGGSTFATNFFNANLNASPANVGYTNLTPSATVSVSGTKMTATVSFTAKVPTYFMGVMGFSNTNISGSSTASYTMPTYINFYLMLDVSGSMSFPSTQAEQARLMAVNPDNLQGSPGYPQGCQFACHFSAQGACGQNAPSNPYQGPIPSTTSATNNGGGYCQGFIISRLGTTPATIPTPTSPNPNNNITNGDYVNWDNSQVTSCPTAGTTSCIQLRADAVGYAVTTLLSTAASAEQVTNQYQVGLFPFIQYLYGCTSVTPCSASNAYVPLTTNLTGSTITNAAANLASLLDTGANSNLGSGGTHFENALASMNSAIPTSAIGTGAGSSNAVPYIFIVTDGSQDYQTQWTGNWGSQNWSYSSAVPYQNSATTIPPNSVTTTDYCTNIKNRGITIAILYIPYQPIADPSTIFNDEDGYANSNIPPVSNNIPTALQKCASPNFYYTANTPADINSALLAMFQQAVNTAHITN